MPGSQLAARIYTTNGAPTVFSRAHTRAHMSVSTQRSSAHADARSERRGGREEKERVREREQEASYLLEWHSTNSNSPAGSGTQAEPR